MDLERDDPDRAADRSAQGRDLRPCPLELNLGLAHVAQQQFTGSRRPDAGAAALEQRHADLVFEAQDLPVDG